MNGPHGSKSGPVNTRQSLFRRHSHGYFASGFCPSAFASHTHARIRSRFVIHYDKKNGFLSNLITTPNLLHMPSRQGDSTPKNCLPLFVLPGGSRYEELNKRHRRHHSDRPPNTLSRLTKRGGRMQILTEDAKSRYLPLRPARQ